MYRYTIEMAVPLGRRAGTLTLAVEGGLVTGSLTLFERSCPIWDGHLDGDRLRFCGEMQTLLYSLPYTADGTVSDRELNLTFETQKGKFSAKGAAPKINGIKK